MKSGFLIEAHYYSAGRKLHAFGGRPDHLPKIDRLGISDNTGISIQEGDLILELARFQGDDANLTWLGVFEKAKDEVHGDRGNTSRGIGIWLEGSILLNAEDSFSLLHQLLTPLGKLDSPKSMPRSYLDQAEKVIRISDVDALPPQLTKGVEGLSFGTGNLNTFTVWHAKLDGGASSFYSCAGNIITLFQLMAEPFRDVSKLYLILSANSPSSYPNVKFGKTLPAENFDFNEGFLRTVLAAEEARRASYNSDETEISSLRSTIQKYESDIQALKTGAPGTTLSNPSDTLEGLSHKLDLVYNAVKRRPAVSNPAANRQSDGSGGDLYLLIFLIVGLLSLIAIAAFGLMYAKDAAQLSAEIRTTIDRRQELSGSPSVDTITAADQLDPGLSPEIDGKYFETKDISAPSLACNLADGTNSIEISGGQMITPKGNCSLSQEEDGTLSCSNDPGTKVKIGSSGVLTIEKLNKQSIFKRCN